jgi:hypothetical protein
MAKTVKDVPKWNEEMFRAAMKTLRPDMFVLMDLLDSTKMNPYVLLHIIHYLNDILLGTKYGKVVIEVERGMVTFIKREETALLEEALKK